jgi:hypothetical protein
MLVILATQETETRIAVRTQPRQIVCKTLSLKALSQKLVRVEWLKVKALSHSTSPAFCDEFFQDRVSQTVCPDQLRTLILLISASWVARIIGVTYQCPAQTDNCDEGLLVIFMWMCIWIFIKRTVTLTKTWIRRHFLQVVSTRNESSGLLGCLSPSLALTTILRVLYADASCSCLTWTFVPWHHAITCIQ